MVVVIRVIIAVVIVVVIITVVPSVVIMPRVVAPRIVVPRIVPPVSPMVSVVRTPSRSPAPWVIPSGIVVIVVAPVPWIWVGNDVYRIG